MSFISDITEKTAAMNSKEKLEYIFTYYWYHMLLLTAFLGLIIFLIAHFAFPSKEAVFNCAIVNQKMDADLDESMEESFAKASGLEKDLVNFDSAYIFSYRDVELESADEGLYEKFFFAWSNGQLDAVVMTKDFFDYCIDMSGSFYDLAEFDTGNLSLFKAGKAQAIELSDTEFGSYFPDKGENLLLAFPSTGKNYDNIQLFIDYIRD